MSFQVHGTTAEAKAPVNVTVHGTDAQPAFHIDSLDHIRLFPVANLSHIDIPAPCGAPVTE